MNKPPYNQQIPAQASIYQYVDLSVHTSTIIVHIQRIALAVVTSRTDLSAIDTLNRLITQTRMKESTQHLEIIG